MHKAYYHLPGLFEYEELYRLFLPLYREHREYFFDWCEIASVYGAPSDCLWGGGRVGFGNRSPQEVKRLYEAYGISARLTFSNSLLKTEHLSDELCNALCRLFEHGSGVQNGVIVHSDLLLHYIRKNYPGFYFVSSTTKVLTDFKDLYHEVCREDYRYVVPDFRLNKDFLNLSTLNALQKEKLEFLCNECCDINCKERRACYEAVSRLNLGEPDREHICHAPGAKQGYRFSKAMESPAFIGTKDIVNTYLPMGFQQFKIEGRGLGSAVILEFLLYYLIQPQYHLKVREAVYLDSMLDLF